MYTKKNLFKLVFVFMTALTVGSFLYFAKADSAESALSSASVTLSNSRFSYRGGVNGTPGIGSTTINIDTTDDTNANGDIDTNHLFPNDPVCFSDAGMNGCTDNTTYTVGSIVDSDTFTIGSGLGSALETTDLVIASQEAKHTIAFTIGADIPDSGDILVTIPAVDITGETNDGIPDTNATVATNGFDLNGLGTGDVSIATSTSGTCDNNDWSVAAVNAGDASNDHTIRIDRSGSNCEANATTLTITVGTGSTLMINPAPADGDNHTQGSADVYTIDVTTRGTSDETIETADLKVAPVEAVLVTAEVDETLTFTVAGVSSSSTRCNQTTNYTTTATSVPFGSSASPITNQNSILYAAHDLTVSTNYASGYAVTTLHTDQLGLNGGTCTGDAGEGANCIPDTTCDGSCSHTSADDWVTGTNNGLGYALETAAGTNVAAFEYDSTTDDSCGGGVFCARQFADEQAGEPAQDIMTSSAPVDTDTVYMCYALSISGTQPAGSYQTIVRYTATPVF